MSQPIILTPADLEALTAKAAAASNPDQPMLAMSLPAAVVLALVQRLIQADAVIKQCLEAWDSDSQDAFGWAIDALHAYCAPPVARAAEEGQ